MMKLVWQHEFNNDYEFPHRKFSPPEYPNASQLNNLTKMYLRMDLRLRLRHPLALATGVIAPEIWLHESTMDSLPQHHHSP
jgi:hypothetical protein